MERVFPLLCSVTTLISAVAVYLLEAKLALGVRTFVLGFLVQYSCQILAQVAVLIAKSDRACYRFPDLGALASKNRRMVQFVCDYSLATWFEHFSYEVLALILLLSAEPDVNIGVWSVLAQAINLVYYLGYGLSAYVRQAGSQLIVRNDFCNFKRLLAQSSQFLSAILLIGLVLVLAFAEPLSRLFFREAAYVELTTVSLRILCLQIFPEGFAVYLDSVLRMMGEESFVFWMNFGFYFVLVPACSFVATYGFRTGVIGVLCVLVSAGLICIVWFVVKLLKNLGKKFEKTYLTLQNGNVDIGDAYEDESRESLTQKHN